MRTRIHRAPTADPSECRLVAIRGGRAVGRVAIHHMADGLVELSPPVADGPAAVDALAAALGEHLRTGEVAVGQCLLPAGDSSPVLARADFRLVTRLVTLCREPAPFTTSEVAIEPDAPELVATFAETLVGSLDLPELTGLRPPHVELAGYPATHRLVARIDDRPAGLLLLAAGEILYLGVVATHRRRGLGTSLLHHALSALAADTAPVVVSADARNTPALRLYAGHGFRPCRWQDVFLWTARK